MALNLHAIVSPMIAAVNPQLAATLSMGAGYSTLPTGKRVPVYLAPLAITAQVQALAGQELTQVEGLNIEGVKRAMYLNGNVSGVDRAAQDGGDLITFGSTPDIPAPLQGTFWLVVMVLEAWDNGGWCKVAVTKQNGA